MERVSSEADYLATSPRINGNILSFTSSPGVQDVSVVEKVNSPTQANALEDNLDIVPRAADSSQRHFVGLQGNSEQTDDDDDGLTYDSSGLIIPRLRESMTPWRAVDNKNKRDTKRTASHSAILMDVSSPTNSRPATRNSLFSLEGASTVASSSGSNELEHLQKQLTTYKLKIRTLLELIKQLNYGDSEERNRDSFYGKILSSLSQSDEIDELRRNLAHLEKTNQVKQEKIIDLEKEVSLLSKQLLETKDEHAETLEYANEYLEHSELLARDVDEMLNLLLENLELSDEERDALQKTIQISSSFAMVKMNALKASFRKVLQSMKSSCGMEREEERKNRSSITAIANSTEIGETAHEEDSSKNDSFALDESAIDTRLEIAIEGLHEEYDKFFRGIRSKIEKSAELEKLLLNRLSRQDKLLKRIAEASKIESEGQSSANCNHDSILSSIDESSKRASLELSKSYKEHIDNLNALVQALNSAMLEKNQELEHLSDQLRDQEKLRKSESRVRNEFENYKEMTKLKENNWESFVGDLEESVQVLQLEKEHMSELVDQLNSDLKTNKSEVDTLLMDLDNANHRARNILDIHKRDKEVFKAELNERAQEIETLQEECNKLRQLVVDLKRNTSAQNRYQNEFQIFKDHLLLHLENVFNTLGKILQQTSVDQSRRKLEMIRRMDGLTGAKSMQPKLESLYSFIETAQESIVESYTSLILHEKGKRYSDGEKGKELKLRIEELERKWVSERERRKLDSSAAETRIHRLESENELLREQLYNMTLRK